MSRWFDKGLTAEQREALELMIPISTLRDKFGNIICQTRQTVEEFVRDNKNSWTVQEILKRK